MKTMTFWDGRDFSFFVLNPKEILKKTLNKHNLQVFANSTFIKEEKDEGKGEKVGKN